MKKTFDCVAMKQRGAQAIYRQIAGMTPTQQLEYWQKHTRALKRRQQVQRGATVLPSRKRARAANPRVAA